MILQPKDKCDENIPKKKEDRSSKDPRTREFKSRGRSYQDDRGFDEPRDYKRRNYKDDKKDEETQEVSNESNGRRKIIDKKKKFEKKNYYDDDGRKNDKFRKVKKESERDRKRKEIWLKKVTERKTAQAKTDTNEIDNVKDDKKDEKRRHSLDLCDSQNPPIVILKRRNSCDSGPENIEVTFTKENKSTKQPIVTQKEDEKKDSFKSENRGRKTDYSPRSKKNEDGGSKRKDPRTDRRIKNKDRPSIEIYRPGMGKFSKQRIEKEKVSIPGTDNDSPPHSPSPTEKNQP